MPRLRSAGELLGRSAQALRVLQERLGGGPAGTVPPGASLTPAMPFRHLDAAALGRLFDRHPAEREAIVSAADGALDGQFGLLGFERLHFGFPPNWHADPTRGTRAPLRHWSQVPFLDAAVAGDHKVVWEVNRHQWLITLAQAAVLTGEHRYAEGIAVALDDWLRSNPPRQGINWASSLELAFRAISWTWVLHLLGGHLPGPDDLGRRALASLDLHGKQIERFLSTWFSPNTHLTGEALGLLYLGTAWPGLSGASRWRALGWRILLEQLPIHVREDGTYFEQTTWYQGYTVDFYLHALALARHNEFEVPAWATSRIDAATRVLEALVRPDGTIPLLGDDDGGRLLPLDPERTSFADTIALGTRLLQRPATCGIIKVSLAPAWLGWGETQTHSSADTQASLGFPNGGLYVLRGGRGVMVVDAGVHGVLAGGHSHADTLSLALTIGGTAVVVDPGTGAYVGEWRDRLRGWDAHNGMTLARGGGPPCPSGAFRWRGRWPVVTVRHWRVGPGWAVLQAEHDGLRDDGGLRHRRSVILFEEFGWLVVDQLAGGDEPCRLGYQLAPGLAVTDSPTGLTIGAGGEPVATMVADGHGRLTIGEGLVSCWYGQAVPAPRITVDVDGIEARRGVGVAFSARPGGTLTSRDGDGSRSWTWQAGSQVLAVTLLPTGALVATGPDLTLALD